MEDNQIILTGGSSASKHRLNHFNIIAIHDLGSGLIEAISSIALRSGNEVIVVVDTEKLNISDKINQLKSIKDEQFKIESIISGEKEFKCKGKHQYRQIGKEWICECNRNIND